MCLDCFKNMSPQLKIAFAVVVVLLLFLVIRWKLSEKLLSHIRENMESPVKKLNDLVKSKVVDPGMSYMGLV